MPVSSASPTPVHVRVLAWLATFIGATLVTLVALTLLTAVGAGPVLDLAVGAVDAEVDTPDDRGFDPLRERSRIVDADGETMAVLHDEVDRRVVDRDEIPEHVENAVLTAEDRNFFEHAGYDVEGIGRALLANIEAQSVEQGGSTITQQLAKQNLVGDDRTIQRKVEEIVQAVALEDELAKHELLERYLNQVYFGSGAYGVAAAAEEFFRAEPDELEPHESALLAGLIRAPGALDPRQNPEGAEQRRDAILDGMGAEGHLTAEEVRAAQSEPIEVQPRLERSSDDPFVVEAVKREFVANTAFGEDREERWDALLSGGYVIHATIDPRVQDAADETLDAHFGEEPTGAIAAVDPRTGKVRALASGVDFDDDQYDLATQGRRQPGSAFKPFVAATALSEGFPTAMSLEGDSPAYFEAVRGWDRDDDGVRNFGGSSFGTVDLATAMRSSVNTAFAELVLATGHEAVMETSESLGIDADRAYGGSDGPAIALGGLETGVTPLEMASAFGVFANAGEYASPFLIERVEGADGEIVYEREPDPAEALHPAVADEIRTLLEGVVRNGTGTAASLPSWPVAGKTGTTQNSADAWFVGTTPVLSTAVWMGHPEGQIEMPGVTGGSDVAPVWRDFMATALDPVEPESFPTVDASLAEVRDDASVDVPDVRGDDVDAARQTLLDARLTIRTQDVADAAAAGTVLWQHPAPTGTARPGDAITLGVSTGSPPAPSPPPTPDEESSEDDAGTPEDSEPSEEEDSEPSEDDEPTEDPPADDEPADDEPTEDPPADDEPTDDEPTDDEPTEDPPADDDEQLEEDEPVDPDEEGGESQADDEDAAGDDGASEEE